MRGWVIFHSALSVLGLGLMIMYIFEGNTPYASINAFTFLANVIMLFFEIRNDAKGGLDE